MLSYRLRGLVNLQIAASTVVAVGYFLALALAVPYLPRLALSHNVSLPLYSLPIFAGMFLSARHWQNRAHKFHAITWTDAAVLSIRQIVLVALMIFGLIVATKDREISRVFLAFYLVSCALLLALFNRYLPAYLSRLAFQSNHRIRALFVGTPATVEPLNAWIKRKEHLGIDAIGLLSDTEIPGAGSAHLKWLGPVSALSAAISEYNIGQVILLDLPHNQLDTMYFVTACQSAGCRLMIHQNFGHLLPIPMVPVVEENLFFLTIHDEPLEDPLNRGIKRACDVALSLPVVVLILPLLSVIVFALQQLQAPGPLLFARKRGGQRNREFSMLKFRSMYAAPADPQQEARQASQGDSRIYPFGRFLRKTSLDEFPQFWNVLIGDMSIVGPRPHLPQHDNEFSHVAKAYRTRQLVKPGLTGLAQVSGYRGEIRDPEMLYNRVRLDIQYITQWSVWLDVQIIVRTCIQILFPPESAQ